MSGRTSLGTSRRAHLRWLGTAAGGLGLTGCQVGPSAPEKKTLPPSTVQWQMMSDPDYPKLAEEASKLFQQEYPQVKIDAQSVPPGGPARLERTMTTFVAGEGPDVVQLWAPFTLELAGRGLLMKSG